VDLARLQQELARCNRCGFCQAACPVFHATGHEAGVARGRLSLISALAEGALPWSREVEEPLFNCLLCGACTAHCFPAVPTADLMVAAREAYLKRMGASRMHRLLFERLLPYPARLRFVVRLAARASDPRLLGLAEALGLLRFLGRDFPQKLGLLGRPAGPAFRERVGPQVLTGRGKDLKLAYFVGCGMDLVRPEAAAASLELMLDMGRSVTVLPNNCCGLPAHAYGDVEAARNLARRNLKLLGGRPYDLVVTDCSSCAAFLKSYPALFSGDDEMEEAATRLASRVQDLAQVLDRADPGRGRLAIPAAVTYHDPCHAARGQGFSQEPRQALGRIQGVEFREMEEADWCCGGAGAYSLSHYALARRIMDRKSENIRRTGAELVVSSCPSCLIHLEYGCRLAGLPVRALHLSQVVLAGRRGGRLGVPGPAREKAG
jgi:glycolate oxidase iron-sulfur subunit